MGPAGGAEEIFISEQPITVDQAIQHIKGGIQRGKMSSILVTAEGQKAGRAYDLAEKHTKKRALMPMFVYWGIFNGEEFPRLGIVTWPVAWVLPRLLV